MFNIFKKKPQTISKWLPGKIYATQTGTAVPLSDVPDDVINAGILGQGIAIIPKDGHVVSPVNAKIVSIADSLHAFCLQTEDGIDLLIHIGIDSVELNGEGFKVSVSEGDLVMAGEPLCEVDLKLFKKKGINTHTAILISNPEKSPAINAILGDVEAGLSLVITY